MTDLERYAPDLIIGGAPRSATTFLCEVLDKHPDAFVAKPFIPEPKVLTQHDPEGEGGYARRYRALFAHAPPGTLRIEKTSNYFESAEARARIADLLPNVRMLFIVREPVERAYSNWAWSTRNGLETLSFRDSITVEAEHPRLLPAHLRYARPFDYVARSRYGDLAAAWIASLGGDRVNFLLFEDVVGAPEASIPRLQQMLGLSPMPWERLRAGVVNPSGSEGCGDPDLVATLRERLRPDVERFAKLTGLDVRCWGYGG